MGIELTVARVGVLCVIFASNASFVLVKVLSYGVRYFVIMKFVINPMRVAISIVVLEFGAVMMLG